MSEHQAENDTEELERVARGRTHELRMSWWRSANRHYLSLRVFEQDYLGRWWPSQKRGIVIAPSELPELHAALLKAAAKALETQIDDELRTRIAAIASHRAEPETHGA
jgi:hypothetical protein